MMPIQIIFRLLRVTQWHKAIFVLLGVLYSGAWALMPQAFIAGVIFCLTASVTYVYNDIKDYTKDRLHPQKCKRPIANNEISFKQAVVVLIGLLGVSLGLAYWFNTIFFLIVLAYLGLNLAYNHGFKNVVLLDVSCIAIGFMLRVLAGTMGIGLPISRWLMLTSMLISLFIAFSKRRLEKNLNLAPNTRKVLQYYSQYSLNIALISTGLLTFGAYMAYVCCVHSLSGWFKLTLPFALFGLGRFYYLTLQTITTHEPTILIVQDKISQLNLCIFLALTLRAIYS